MSENEDGPPADVSDDARAIAGVWFGLDGRPRRGMPVMSSPTTDHEGLVERLVERYTADVPPPCRVCGRALTIQRAGGGCATEWGCDGLEADPDNPGMLRRAPGYEFSSEHYQRSKWTQVRAGDNDVLEAAKLISRLMEENSRAVEKLKMLRTIEDACHNYLQVEIVDEVIAALDRLPTSPGSGE